MTTGDLARAYGVPLVDYGRGRGVLVGSGCGLMLGVMDTVPFRYCVDVDTMPKGARLEDFLVCASMQGPLAVCGWFSHHDPEPLRRALETVWRWAKHPVVTYGGHAQQRLGVPGECETLDEFLHQCWEAFS